MTMWYNEEFLAPFFLNHYAWVDKIHILLDADTNDNTEQIIRKYDNTEIEYFKFPDMMDDLLKVDAFNNKYKTIDADYVILVDSDEFIFSNIISKPVRSHINETCKDVYFVNLWQVYKHETDLPLDPSLPIAIQRRHGLPDLQHREYFYYIKPAVVRSGKDLSWGVGNHELTYERTKLQWWTSDIQAMKDLNVSTEKHEMLQGAHWRIVDLYQALKRKINNRKQRQSQVNLTNGLSGHYHNITYHDIVNEYYDNLQNPIVIENKFYDYLGHTNKYLCDSLVDTGFADEMHEMAIDFIFKGQIRNAIVILKKAVHYEPNNKKNTILLKECLEYLECLQRL